MSKLKTISALTFAAFALVGCKETGANESKPVVATTAITSKSNVMDCRATDVRDFISEAFKETPKFQETYDQIEASLPDIDMSDIKDKQDKELFDFVNKYGDIAVANVTDIKNDQTFTEVYQAHGEVCRAEAFGVAEGLGISLDRANNGQIKRVVWEDNWNAIFYGCFSDDLSGLDSLPNVAPEVHKYLESNSKDLATLLQKREAILEEFLELQQEWEIEYDQTASSRYRASRGVLEELKVTTNAIMVEKEDRNGTVLCRANVRLNLFENSDDLGTVNYIVEDLDNEKQVTILNE